MAYKGKDMYVNNDVNWIKLLKKKNVYIWGCGRRGRSLLKQLEKNGINTKGFIDNNIDMINETIGGKRILIPSLQDISFVKEPIYFIVISSAREKEIKLQLLEMGIYNYVSETYLDFGGGAEHYDESYFEWQKSIGKVINKKSLFHEYINTDMKVIEFGSGGGFLLQTINAKEKIGVEINPYAREFAKNNGILSVETAEEIQDEWADIIISSHALEHVENPLDILKVLFKKLKHDGLMVFVVPSEPVDREYIKSDINNHLWSWNCLTLGNLFKAAGFFINRVERISTFWPCGYEVIRREVSKELFQEISRLEGYASGEGNLIIIAEK